nr:uncharacterized protein LOC111425785 [Onthophagus taurus]
MFKLIFYVLVLICLTNSLPIDDENINKEINEPKPVEVTETFIPVTTNGSKDVYVIKTIVYEVGILTEADNSTLNDTETHEEVNLTFFDPKHNGTTIDLSNIPVPIQTNISGVEITGLAPANFGTIQLSEDGKPAILKPEFPLQVPLLPNAVISVKHNISTSNVDKETALLGNLPNLLGLTSPITGEPLTVQTPQVNDEKVEEKEGEVKESKREIKDENDEKKDKNKDDKENKDGDTEEDNDAKEDKSGEDKDDDKKDKKSENDKNDSVEKDNSSSNSSSSEESDESKGSSEEKKA